MGEFQIIAYSQHNNKNLPVPYQYCLILTTSYVAM